MAFVVEPLFLAHGLEAKIRRHRIGRWQSQQGRGCHTKETWSIPSISHLFCRWRTINTNIPHGSSVDQLRTTREQTGQDPPRQMVHDTRPQRKVQDRQGCHTARSLTADKNVQFSGIQRYVHFRSKLYPSRLRVSYHRDALKMRQIKGL